jgi:hypothetical protein
MEASEESMIAGTSGPPPPQFTNHSYEFVERRGRMVRTSDSQPNGCGFESRHVSEQDALKSSSG